MSRLNGLQRLSLLLVLAGLTAIYASSTLLKPEKADIGELSESELGETVRVTGEVRDLSTTEEAVFFDLEGKEGSIRAVHFGQGLDIEEGRAYTFRGRIDIYRGELEIVVENVVSGVSGAGQPG